MEPGRINERAFIKAVSILQGAEIRGDRKKDAVLTIPVDAFFNNLLLQARYLDNLGEALEIEEKKRLGEDSPFLGVDDWDYWKEEVLEKSIFN